jgi:small-conductance mechanosensitive channel
VTLCFTIAGFYFAIGTLDIDPDIKTLVNNVLTAIVIIALTLWFAELLVRLLVAAVPSKPGRASPITGVVQNVVRIFVMLVGFVLMLGTFGISVAPMVTTLGIGGLAVALGLQETLANVFAGMQLTIARNMRVGDILGLEEGEELVLEDIGWRAVRMRRLFTDVSVIVPNSRLAHDRITNYDLPTSEIGVLVECGVHYTSNLREVDRIACEVAREVMKEVKGAKSTHEPFLRFTKFNSSSIDFVIHLRALGFRESTLVRSEFIVRLSERFAREGIVIPFPITAINLEQEKAERALAKQ